jgi:hypothetical protein
VQMSHKRQVIGRDSCQAAGDHTGRLHMQILRDEDVIDSRQRTGAKPSWFWSVREVVSLRVSKEIFKTLVAW